jgi:hypothetical protein
VLGVGIGSHADSAPTFEAMRKALRTCTSFRVVDRSGVTQASVHRLRLPSFGQDTLAVRFVTRVAGGVLTYDAVRIHVGHNVILADLGTPGTARPNTKPLVTAVKNALLNLS